MDECAKTTNDFSKNLSPGPTQSSVYRVGRKWKRNKCRISRRKRKKVEYLISRKELRIKRNNLKRLSLTVFDIADMEYYQNPLLEVKDWSQRHELAYWKSRALSLQLENLKLTSMVESFGKIATQDFRNKPLLESEYYNLVPSVYGNVYSSEEVENVRGKKAKAKKYQDDTYIEPPSKRNEEEIKRQQQALYGSMAPKIKGMETAIQLNYDMYVEKNKPAYWPNIPLNL